jgi:hypothetical protein
MKVRADDTTACGFSIDKVLRVNCGVAIVFDIIESRHRGIVVTLANDIDESVKLSESDGGRAELTVV